MIEQAKLGSEDPAVWRIDENAAALQVELDEPTMQRIFEIAKPGLAVGATLL